MASQEPDLNAIEKLWNIIGVRVAARQPRNVHELREKISEVWNEITPQECRKLILGMRKRITMCLKEKGGPIDY